jgi:hypothetical protein
MSRAKKSILAAVAAWFMFMPLSSMASLSVNEQSVNRGVVTEGTRGSSAILATTGVGAKVPLAASLSASTSALSADDRAPRTVVAMSGQESALLLLTALVGFVLLSNRSSI